MASVHPPNGTDMDLHHVQQLLRGYNSLEWPNLSATRAPRDDIHTTTLQLPHITGINPISAILVAVARTLGVYCGASDVLLAVQLVDNDAVTFVRTTWSESDTWADLAGVVNHSLLACQERRISVEAIRRVLDIGDKQSPCIALCQFLSRPVFVHSSYALTFIYDTSKSVIHLSSSQIHTHPSISSQILAQLAALTSHSHTHPDSFITSTLSLSSGLMSVYDRVADNEMLAEAYPHLVSTPFATDYLAQRAVTAPRSTAVRWYPNLSPETKIDDCESIDYAKLDKKANQVARWLRKMGLENEDRVAVCMKRDLLFHITLMAIMRAGGCYVPARIPQLFFAFL
jgi:hypothetical protein